MDGAGPFCVSVPKHPDPVGGIVEIEAPDHGEVAPDLEPPVSPPAPHVEAQAVLYMIPGTEPVVLPKPETPTIYAPMPEAGIRSSFLPKSLGKLRTRMPVLPYFFLQISIFSVMHKA